MRTIRTSRGFTLVEIALVVVIASILLIAGMRLMLARAESAQIELTRKNEDTIRVALISYLGQTKRLPCPDTDFDGHENRNIPTPPGPCNAYAGSLPYADLGLDRSAVLDGWDNYIEYVVSPPSSVPAVPIATPQWTTSWLYTYVPVVVDPTTQVSLGSLAFWPTVSTGSIVVTDSQGNVISNPAAIVPTGAVVALISYGRNGYGATNISGSKNDSSVAVFDELTNINPITVPGPPMQINVVNRDITDQNIANHGPFDDIVLPLRQNDLVAPLIASGTFQTTPMLALNQANDYVIGQLAPGRAACPGCGACALGNYYYPVPATMALPATSSIIYAQGLPPAAPVASCISAISTPTTVAYTLSAQDGNTRSVTNAEAIGILGRVGGF